MHGIRSQSAIFAMNLSLMTGSAKAAITAVRTATTPAVTKKTTARSVVVAATTIGATTAICTLTVPEMKDATVPTAAPAFTT